MAETCSHTHKDSVRLDIIIPTLGERIHIQRVLTQLQNYTKKHENLLVRIFVSFNPRTNCQQIAPINAALFKGSCLHVTVISPETYQRTSEAHLLWCLRWYKNNINDDAAYIWTLTDNDDIIPTGFDALVAFLRSAQANTPPDILIVNNLWGTALGTALPSPAFRCNAETWHGDASYFFRSVGYEHAPSTIGTFVLRSGFLQPEILDLLGTTLDRSEICAHAWWLFEAGTHTTNFYFLATPILVNKFNLHNFDHAPTWRRHIRDKKIPTKYPWTIGYLRHLAYYIDSGILTYQQIRTSVISEPERGILPFLDDILRQLFQQARLALRNKSERFAAEDINLIQRIFENCFPLRLSMIESLCIILNENITNQHDRLYHYKAAQHFYAAELEQGSFSSLFFRTTDSYSVFEHNLGYVAILDKKYTDLAYRDLDPIDLAPFIFYALTKSDLYSKIKQATTTGEYINALLPTAYPAVVLERPFMPPMLCTSLQLYIHALPPKIGKMFLPISNLVMHIYKFYTYCGERFGNK